MTEWAVEILDGIEPIATLLDSSEPGNDSMNALNAQRDKLANSQLTPSGQIMMDMQTEPLPWFHFAMNKSLSHAEYFRQRPPQPQDMEFFHRAAGESLAAQAAH